MNMKFCIIISLLLIITGCKKNYNVDEKKENQLFQFTEIGSKEIVYEKSDISTVIIDSLITDINDDKINDKILIKANRDESYVFGDKYFKNIDEYRRILCILISKKKDNYLQIDNKKFIPCLRCNEPMDAYSDFQLENSKAFSVKILQKDDEIIYKLLFVWNKDNFFLTEIQSSNFYDSKIKKYKISDRIDIQQFDYKKIPDYINNKHRIQDPDGFTNLRKDKSTSSEIIQKIKSGEQIEILDNSGDWFLVRTKEGKEGYVHKSRIKN